MPHHTNYANLILLLILAVLVVMSAYPIGGRKPIVIPTAAPAGPPGAHTAPTQVGASYESLDPTMDPAAPTPEPVVTATQPGYPPPLETPGYPYP